MFTSLESAAKCLSGVDSGYQMLVLAAKLPAGTETVYVVRYTGCPVPAAVTADVGDATRMYEVARAAGLASESSPEDWKIPVDYVPKMVLQRMVPAGSATQAHDAETIAAFLASDNERVNRAMEIIGKSNGPKIDLLESVIDAA